MNIIDEFRGNSNIVFILPHDKYSGYTAKIVKEVLQGYERICYVTISKSYKSVLEKFKNEGIGCRNIYFVDAITKTVSSKPHILELLMPAKKVKSKYFFVTNPKALIELSLAISDLLENRRNELVVLDSVNTLMIYNENKEIMKFLHYVMAKISENRCKGIFLFAADEKKSTLVKEISLFADKVIDLRKESFTISSC